MVFGVQVVLIIQEIWQKKGFVCSIFCIECDVCNLSMNLIGEIIVRHGLQLSLAEDT